MAILGLFTSIGLSKTIDADSNEGFYIHPEKFGISRNVGPLDPSRTGPNAGEWFVANISSRTVVDYNTIKFICTIPPGSSLVVENVKEIYIYAKDSLNNDFLLALGQPTENIIYDPDGTITLEIQISLVDVDLTANYIFNYTQATELAEHVTDPSAHPEISDAMAKAGIFVVGGSIPFDYQGQDFEEPVEFEGTKSTVNYGGLTFSALFNGIETNGANLIFDGIKDSDTIVTEWNNSNPNAMIGHNGTGSEILAAGSAILINGTYVVQNKDLVYRDTDGVYKRALADGSIKAKAVGMAIRANRRVVHRGLMNYTSGHAVGTIIYLSSSAYGGFQTVNNGISLGIVLKSNLILFTGFSGAAAVNINQSFDAIVTTTTGLGLFSTTQAAINAVPVNGRILIDVLEDLKATIDTIGKSVELVFNGPTKGWRKYAGSIASFKVDFATVPDNGTWRIEWNGQESADLAYNANALAVQTEFNLFAGHTGVTVTGDYTVGFTFNFLDNIPQPLPTFVHSGLNEIQRFNLGNIPDNGTITFDHEANISANYAWNDNTAQLEAYLEALASITDVTVTGSFAAQFFQIEFTGGVLVDGLQPKNPIIVTAKTLNLGGTDTLVNGSNITPINPIAIQQGRYPASNLRTGVTPSAITATELTIGEPVGPETAIVLDADNIRISGYGVIQDFEVGIDVNDQDNTVIAARFDNTTLPIKAGDKLPGLEADFSETWGFAKDIFSQMRVLEHPSNKKRLKISTANVLLPTGIEMIQELESLMLDFEGAEIDFVTGNVYKADGVTSLGLNFTPVIPAATNYRWASITVIPKEVSTDLKMVGQVLVLFGSADGVSELLAPKAPFGSGKPLAQIALHGDLGVAEVTRVVATRDIFQSLSGKFFKIFDDVGSVGVWFDVDNLGTPAPAGALACSRQIEISTVNENDNPNIVAQKIQAVIDADAKFSASVTTNRVLITDVSLGARTDATAETSGFFIDVITQGIDTDVTGLTDLTNESIKQLGTGSGGGSGGIGAGDIFLEDLKFELIDSFYNLMTSNIFELDDEDLLATNTGEYLIVEKQLELDVGEQIVSTDMLDIQHKQALIDVDKVSLTVKYDYDYTDPNPTIEVSRDGGTNYQAMTVETNANGIYHGDLEFVDEPSFATLVEYALANADTQLAFNTSTAQERSQEFLTHLTNYDVYVQLEVAFNKLGSPAGYIQAKIVKDNAGSPSVDVEDIVWMSAPISMVSLGVGDTTKQLSINKHVFDINTKYHIVFFTDATYKASYVAVTHQVGIKVDASAPTIPDSKTWDGAVWASVAANSIVHKLTGRTLDMRVRITSSAVGTRLIGYGIFYQTENAASNPWYTNIEIHHFSGDDNITSFQLTQFYPNADFAEACLSQSGQVWKYPAFDIQGDTIIFPANTFNVPGQSLTLRFDQVKGGAYDNSDRNLALLTANHLGSTDTNIDKSVANRGIFLRNNPALREVLLNDDDEIEIWST